MVLINDWIAYVEEPSLFDRSHFESLILELDTEAKLYKAFDQLPNSQAFLDGIISIRANTDSNGTYRFGRPHKVTEFDYGLAEDYRNHVFDFLKDINDLDGEKLLDSPIVEITKEEYRAKKRKGDLALLNATMAIEDEFIDAEMEGPEWLGGLYESVYMMTTIPEVTRYLLSPFVKFPLDEKPAVDLWLRGHRIDFCQDRTLLIIGSTSI